jgi:hypothetical protein
MCQVCAAQHGSSVSGEASLELFSHSTISQRTPLALTLSPSQSRLACCLDGPLSCISKASSDRPTQNEIFAVAFETEVSTSVHH